MLLNTIAHNAANYMSNLEKYKSVRTICRLEIVKAKYEKQQRFLHKIHNPNKETKTKQVLYSKRIFNVLKCLNEDLRLIIEKEFLTNSKVIDWYEDYYSRSTYYKRRKEAINQFLFYYLDYQ